MTVGENATIRIQGRHVSSASAPVPPSLPLSRLWIDCGWSKGHTVIDEDGMEPWRIKGWEELVGRFPPHRMIFIEGAEPLVKDELADMGYDVWYCNTLVTQEARKKHGLKKSDAQDVLVQRNYVSKWYPWVRTEPVVEEGLKIWNVFRYHREKLKAFKYWRKAQTYRDEEFIRRETVDLESKLEQSKKALREFCGRTKLHELHLSGRHAPHSYDPKTPPIPLYGISCRTVVCAMLKRPWTYRSVYAWKHSMGVTHKVWDPERALRRSRGCDAELKSVIHGSMLSFLNRKSPWRQRYDDAREGLEDTVKRSGPGRADYNVTAHEKAINRAIKTPIIEWLYFALREWGQGVGLDAR